MKNLDLIKKKEADRYFFRNRNSISNLTDKKIDFGKKYPENL